MEQRQDFIFGIRAVTEAIKSGKEIDRILLLKKHGSHLQHELFSLIREYSLPFQFVPVEKLNRLTKKNHQGVIAFLSLISYTPLEEFVISCFDNARDPFILVLDQITDVGNFGAIARSAECMGIDLIVIPDKGSAGVNADSVKASSGALLRLPVSRVRSLKNTLKYLGSSGVRIIAGTEKAEKDAGSADFSGPLAIVLGSEDTGISADLLRMSDELIRIPLKGSISSLNVSAAAAILLYEAMKQRS